MASYEFFGKSKLAKGLSYPVSFTTIDALVNSGAFPNLVGLWYSGCGDNQLVSARYEGPRSHDESAALTIWISAVPSSMRKRLNELLVTKGLPALSDWALQFSDSSLAFSQLDHTCTIRYNCVPSATDEALKEYRLEIDEKLPDFRKTNGRFRANIRHNSGGRCEWTVVRI